MKTKHFRLPKPFAEKWLAALRGGEYIQGQEQLIVLPYEDDQENTLSPEEIDKLDFKQCKFCCLGVAAHIAGFEKSIIDTETLLNPGLFGASEVPEELLEIDDEAENIGQWNQFSLVLSVLNDGLDKSNYKHHFKGRYYSWRTLNPEYHNFNEVSILEFSFEQIADFIEDNTEFYEVEESKIEKNDKS